MKSTLTVWNDYENNVTEYKIRLDNWEIEDIIGSFDEKTLKYFLKLTARGASASDWIQALSIIFRKEKGIRDG